MFLLFLDNWQFHFNIILDLYTATSRFFITDIDGEKIFCNRHMPPKIYKSRGSNLQIVFHRPELYIAAYMPYQRGQREGFRLKYTVSDHSFSKYISDYTNATLYRMGNIGDNISKLIYVINNIVLLI